MARRYLNPNKVHVECGDCKLVFPYDAIPVGDFDHKQMYEAPCCERRYSVQNVDNGRGDEICAVITHGWATGEARDKHQLNTKGIGWPDQLPQKVPPNVAVVQ